MLLLISLQLFAQSDYYVQLAQEKKLSENLAWKALLHMPKEISEVEDERFFLSIDGRVNASAELNATIYSLYHEKSFEDNATACLFPARVHWLKQELSLENLPKVTCKNFDFLAERMDGDSVSLIFPYMQGSSPSSMFGHTFLRIDSKSKPKMMSYAFNYAALHEEEEDSPLVYMYKGFFGGYKGSYSMLPYYEKIKEYRDIEERDIWEYDLNFTKEETAQMIRHMWEVQEKNSSYYFFTQNCAYKMFWMMEVARPSLALRDDFNFHVIPSESIRTSIDAGLVSSTHYRPARSTKLVAYGKKLDHADIDTVFKISADSLTPSQYVNETNASIQTKRYVLDASAEFVEYDYLKKDINSTTYKQRLHAILISRSQLGRGENIEIPKPVDPMLSHRSFRLSADVGVRNSEFIGFLGVRPANHDIKDSDYGYLKGAQIEFMDLLFSYSKDEFRIEKATIISVSALIPRSEFFKPESWRFSLGWDRNYLTESSDFTANYSMGATWGNELGYVYVLVDVFTYINKSPTIGLGGVGGAVFNQGRDFKANMEVTQRIYETSDTQLLFSASEHYRSSQNTALSISYDYVEKNEIDWNTFKLSFDYFF